MTKFLNISTDNTLGGSSASDVLVASQKAVKDYVDTHGGGGGSVAIDGTTITRNANNEIQTVAAINQNTASGATNPIYDWVGTVEEYIDQAVATTHPDWLCFITNKNHNNLSHYLVAAQYPSEANGYSWYFKYSDGWVEQGGIWTGTLSAGNNSDGTSIQNIPIAMADTNYCVNITNNGGTASPTVWEMWCVEQLTTTSFVIHMGAYAATRTITRMNWEVKGMAAS